MLCARGHCAVTVRLRGAAVCRLALLLLELEGVACGLVVAVAALARGRTRHAGLEALAVALEALGLAAAAAFEVVGLAAGCGLWHMVRRRNRVGERTCARQRVSFWG